MPPRLKRSSLLLSTALAVGSLTLAGCGDEGEGGEKGGGDAVGEALTLQQHLVAEMGPKLQAYRDAVQKGDAAATEAAAKALNEVADKEADLAKMLADASAAAGAEAEKAKALVAQAVATQAAIVEKTAAKTAASAEEVGLDKLAGAASALQLTGDELSKKIAGAGEDAVAELHNFVDQFAGEAGGEDAGESGESGN
jgi:hypothetical protein